MGRTSDKMVNSPTTATAAEMEISNNPNQKKDKKKKDNNYTAIKCWFCNKTGHTQIECRT